MFDLQGGRMKNSFFGCIVETYVMYNLRKASKQYAQGKLDGLVETLATVCRLMSKHMVDGVSYQHTMMHNREARALNQLRWIVKQQIEATTGEVSELGERILRKFSEQDIFVYLNGWERNSICDAYNDEAVAGLSEQDRAQAVARKTLTTPGVVVRVVEHVAAMERMAEEPRKTRWAKRREARKASAPGIPAGFFGVEARPPADGRCSDNACPCPETVIPRGGGYLYIPQEIVDFRMKYPERNAAFAAAAGPLQGMAGRHFVRLGPVLVCEEGAKLRNLNLDVAAEDARRWWETGLVPLRTTPLAGAE